MPVHDHPFKLLLQTFFVEFLDAFARDIHRDLNRKTIQFLDKELIRAQRDRHQAKVVDLVARARLRGEESFVLVHIEHQSQRDRQIGLRLFLYAAWLIERYRLPVYPILLTSYDTPRTAEPDRFALPVRGFGLRDFGYRVVQLNRMNWRDFVRRPNPAAAALI